MVNSPLRMALICITPFIFLSCTESLTSKANRLIDEDLKETLHDYKSYEFQSQSNIDSAFTDAADLEEFKNLKERIDKIKVDFDEAINKTKLYHEIFPGGPEELEWLAKAKSIHALINPITDSMKTIITAFNKELKGWTTIRKFRAKNQYGATVLNLYQYDFDKDLTKIINKVDLSETNK